MLIKVEVFPKARKEKIFKKSEDAFEVSVKAKPIRGEATRAVRKTLSLYFKVPEKDIKLIKGFRTRNKIFKISRKSYGGRQYKLISTFRG